MIVYHGTGRCSLESLLSDGPKLWPRQYLGGRRAFSTTTDFKIASLFALRRSPPSVLRGDESAMGVVLEYEVALTSRKGKDWIPAVCSGVLQDEKEIAILNPKVLEVIAIWQVEQDEWVRSGQVRC